MLEQTPLEMYADLEAEVLPVLQSIPLVSDYVTSAAAVTEPPVEFSRPIEAVETSAASSGVSYASTRYSDADMAANEDQPGAQRTAHPAEDNTLLVPPDNLMLFSSKLLYFLRLYFYMSLCIYIYTISKHSPDCQSYLIIGFVLRSEHTFQPICGRGQLLRIASLRAPL